MRVATRFLLVAFAVTLPVLGTITASAAHIHFVGTPTCTLINGGSAVECQGKLAGVGTAPTTVQVVAQFSCTNRGGHNPPGQVSGQSAPIQPSGGNITYDVTTGAGTCPDDMTPHFGRSATINVYQGNTLVFSASVPIT